METPKEIYVLHYDTPLSNGQVGSAWNKEIGLKNECKYVRSDLAELTWEDIWEICTIVDKVRDEFCDNPSMFKLNEITPDSFKKAYGEEVLRRFNEQRNK